LLHELLHELHAHARFLAHYADSSTCSGYRTNYIKNLLASQIVSLFAELSPPGGEQRTKAPVEQQEEAALFNARQLRFAALQ
jgi:hypothetical protein